MQWTMMEKNDAWQTLAVFNYGKKNSNFLSV